MTLLHAFLRRVRSRFAGNGAHADGTLDAAGAAAWRWRAGGPRRGFEAVDTLGDIALSDLQCIDHQKTAVDRNTRQFLNHLPANNVLLWGPRGTGKSSLVRALLNAYHGQGLRLVEVGRDGIPDLPEISRRLRGADGRFIVFSDDLSFETDDADFKSLKAVIDGSVSALPENVLLYATSNRRHLVPKYMAENLDSRMRDGEIHLSEALEEKLSFSERFGIWLAFHPFNQDQYLGIVRHWLTRLGAPPSDPGEVERAALQWALERGSRSGRIAWQFARDWTGHRRLPGS